MALKLLERYYAILNIVLRTLPQNAVWRSFICRAFAQGKDLIWKWPVDHAHSTLVLGLSRCVHVSCGQRLRVGVQEYLCRARNVSLIITHWLEYAILLLLGRQFLDHWSILVVSTGWLESAYFASALHHSQLLFHAVRVEVDLGKLLLLNPPCNIVSNLVKVLAVSIILV